MNPQRPIPDDDPNADVSMDDALEGERVSIPEFLVVSESSGRFRRASLEVGNTIEAGTVIGRVSYNGDPGVAILSRVGGVFLGWLAWDGDRLQRGVPLARIGVNGYGSHPTEVDR